ncbi:MAG: hypothetical protein QOC78_213 [Solirubrobacteraceae bacterium]|nr:hypothetical protein [Solirubrobacteraceae bacterium]
MCGAEAVARAERLWELWENDRDALRDEEVDAPDPKEAYYAYAPESAVLLVDTDVEGGQSGFFRLQAQGLAPLRAAVTEVRVMKPHAETVTPHPRPSPLAGPRELNGAWLRVDAPPPFSLADFAKWLDEYHRKFSDQQVAFARDQRKATGEQDTPAVFAFVYEDEGPTRDETHDAWLFVVLDPETGNGHFARAFHMRASERFVRQPQLAPLQDKSVAIVGVGALGSPVADLLAKAGVGRILLADFDIVTPGNRVRHQSDLSDVGRAKTRAIGNRLKNVDVWNRVDVLTLRVGTAGVLAEENLGQRVDDEAFDAIAAADVVVNLTANSVAGSHVSKLAVEAAVPAVHGTVSAGAWGARILIQRPGASGCWDCLALAQTEPERYERPIEVPEVADDPAVQDATEGGCGDPTFTGPGFELADAAASIARVVVQVLLEDRGGYPQADFDLATLKFREADSALPSAVYTRLPVHPSCPTCNPQP